MAVGRGLHLVLGILRRVQTPEWLGPGASEEMLPVWGCVVLSISYSTGGPASGAVKVFGIGGDTWFVDRGRIRIEVLLIRTEIFAIRDQRSTSRILGVYSGLRRVSCRVRRSCRLSAHVLSFRFMVT